MTSILYTPDGIGYEEEPICDFDDVGIGDEFVFITANRGYEEVNKKVVTVKHISGTGGIAIHEFERGVHFVRRCFHRIVREEVDLGGFDEIFK